MLFGQITEGKLIFDYSIDVLVISEVILQD